ncbi:hypothetical protein NDU88_001225 [Pleurodeles waltl]|uniref:Uncharacterized protein n=1 Tax=Pleurodeles waltl TaxID=8319 RepID=A0AAV7L8U6_PLEWA|nr:hypothetical protein NDU88_001225 [Pleurodeles waltl]
MSLWAARQAAIYVGAPDETVGPRWMAQGLAVVEVVNKASFWIVQIDCWVYCRVQPGRAGCSSGLLTLGGDQLFFNHPEEVWRWLEMWDKVAPGRDLVAPLGAESPDRRSRDAGRLVEAGTGGSAMGSHHRVEIQQVRTMAVVATDLAGGKALERGLGVGGDPAVA